MQRERKMHCSDPIFALHFPLAYLLIHTAQDTKASESSVLMSMAVSLGWDQQLRVPVGKESHYWKAQYSKENWVRHYACIWPLKLYIGDREPKTRIYILLRQIFQDFIEYS